MIQNINNLIIVFTLWIATWAIYTLLWATYLNIDFLSYKVIQLPNKLKCYTEHISKNQSIHCNQGDIDLYSIIHIVIYFTVGLVIPNKYITILIISVGFEIVEYYTGLRGRWWQDPVANIIGYTLGSYANTLHAIQGNVVKIQNYTQNIPIYISLLTFIIMTIILILCKCNDTCSKKKNCTGTICNIINKHAHY